MSANYKKSVWEIDPRWIRVEAVDDLGQSLGHVHFEQNPQFDPSKSGRVEPVRSRQSIASLFWQIVVQPLANTFSYKKSLQSGPLELRDQEA